MHEGFLFKDKRLYVPKSYLCKLLIREAHEGGLMHHFGVDKTLGILQEHFFCPKMKHVINKYYVKCIVCHKAKSKVLNHGLYTFLLITNLHLDRL